MESSEKAEWILRIGIFGSFLGHGVFALGGTPIGAALGLKLKDAWVGYIAAAGIPTATAQQLLPLIGAFDILVAIMALVYPLRVVLIWASFWGFATALIRPVSGEPIWDFVERWANWAAPLALLYLHGLPKNLKDLFKVK
ncbi:MAG TPA: hypothetical protein VJB90_04735 [Candidatus Nanoarchaeia archaeon]|nr:hypothetical protein [Candidatus Nanoarchaeia archaeon]